MSRYTLSPAKLEHEDYEIVVGWDSKLGNFFGEVRGPRVNPADFCGEVVVSVARFRPNASYNNLQSELHEVVKAISDYSAIDDELRKTLWTDSKREGFGLRG